MNTSSSSIQYNDVLMVKHFLESLSFPEDIKSLTLDEKIHLAKEVRERIIEVTSQNGGHLSSSLGTVEMTIALLSIIDLQQDRVIWDVGHQGYAWKILTGRNALFSTLRRKNGISGFLKPSESPHDHFGAGHASTSLSAALGISDARAHSDISSLTYVVIGDGALTGGQAFEALNNIGISKTKLIILLNDNTFSISNNVGAISRFISGSFSDIFVSSIKKTVKNIFQTFPNSEALLQYMRKGTISIKAFLTPGILFEALRCKYIGPIDAHDIASLEKHLAIAQRQTRPVVLHVISQKGKGYSLAENDPIAYHGIAPIKKILLKTLPSYTNIFSETLCSLAKEDLRIFAITAAMPEGTGTINFKKLYPTRFKDVGISEQHAVTYSAGLAKEGMKPFVAIYSTFLQRAYDQILHDVCIQNLPVVFCIDRAGFVGEDGATHHGLYDIAYLRHMPNMSIIAPRNENELIRALHTASQYKSPLAIRYPRGSVVGVECDQIIRTLPIGKGELLVEGSHLIIFSIGSMIHPLLNAIQKISQKYGNYISLYDSKWIKPLPEEEILSLAKQYEYHITVEESTKIGAFSSAICELFMDYGISTKSFTRYGAEDIFYEHGTQNELLHDCSLTEEDLYALLSQYIEDIL
ncbi:MAG: 1-deoxy-D-xylulose-5-phosphate synthase [Desulfovibrionaceae bacterium]